MNTAREISKRGERTMTQKGNHLEISSSAQPPESNSSIDFHSVIDLRQYAGKPLTIIVDSALNEKQSGKTHDLQLSANEKISVIQDGHVQPEHATNKLTVKDGELGLSVKDQSTVLSTDADPHAKGKAHAMGHHFHEAIHDKSAGNSKHGKSDAQFDDEIKKMVKTESMLPPLKIYEPHEDLHAKKS
jgi:hypothetical protein